MRRKAELEEPAPQNETSSSAPSRCSRTWAMLIKPVYEIDARTFPHYGSEMKVVAFTEPPQTEVIEKILRGCGLWQEPASWAPPDIDGLVQDLDFGFSDRQIASLGPVQTQEFTYEDIDTYLATF